MVDNLINSTYSKIVADRIPESSAMSAAQISAEYGRRVTPVRASHPIAHTTISASTKGALLPGMTFEDPRIPRGTPQDFMLKERKPGPLEASGVQPQEQSAVLPPLTGTNIDVRV